MANLRTVDLTVGYQKQKNCAKDNNRHPRREDHWFDRT